MKAVIFDMDGVIIDSEPVHFEVEGELLEELGGVFDEEEHSSFVGTTDYAMWDTFKREFNLKPSVEEMVEMKKERFIENLHRIPLVENVTKVMSILQDNGYLMALASSNNRKAVDAIIERFHLGKYLAYSISGEDVKNGKPDPEIFLTAAKNLNVEPENCLVIEDAANGVKAAKAAGMKCIGFKNPNSGNQDLSKADLVMDSYDQFDLEKIQKLFK